MSAIDELIAELCPDGVEYCPLIDVLAQPVTDGPHETPDLVESGIPLLSVEAIHDGGIDISKCRGYISEADSERYRKKYRPEIGDVYMTKAATVGRIALVDDKAMTAEFDIWSPIAAMRPKTDKLIPRYLFYILHTARIQNLCMKKASKGSQANLSMRKLEKFEIPVPPIEVQREIVRILDSFAELEAELGAELEARKAQYAYYRDRLLSLESLEALDGKPVEMVRLGGVCVRQKGMPITAAKMKELASETGDVVVFGGGKTKVLANRDDLPKSNVIETPSVVVKSRGNIGFEYCDVPFTNKNELWSYAASSSNIDIKFIYHYLESRRAFFQDAAKVGKLPQISTGITDDFQVSLPSLETQQRVVDILDRFDALTTSLTDGLPAEIEARRQQYEHYRDRLLDFPRKEVAAS